MRELSLFVGLQLLLLETDPAPDWAPQTGERSQAPASDISSLAMDLLALGISLHSELDDPTGFLRLAAATATEVARLAAPPGTAAAEAIDRLAAHQRDRLAGRPDDAWRARGPEVHLGRAFWQLCGLAFETTEGPSDDGRLEEHAADCANDLLFAVLTSGAWGLPPSPAAPEDEGSPAPARIPRPEAPTPGLGIPPGSGS